MTPAHAQFSLHMLSSAGMFSIRMLGTPGAHGAGSTGTHGCGVSTPDGFEGLGFTDPDFGRFQNAEALLFYTGSLAVMARSKVFNDGPDDFVAELAGGARRLGQAWTRMFRRARDNDPEGSDPGEVLARCKKVYPWTCSETGACG